MIFVFNNNCRSYSIFFVLVRKCIQSNLRGRGPSLTVCLWCIVFSDKCKSASIAHFSALDEGLGKFLKLIQASFTAQI